MTIKEIESRRGQLAAQEAQGPEERASSTRQVE
jgi:hypothetical protein